MSPNVMAPLSSNFYSQINNQDIKRPLKTNHSDLSFKGLSLGYNKLAKIYLNPTIIQGLKLSILDILNFKKLSDLLISWVSKLRE